MPYQNKCYARGGLEEMRGGALACGKKHISEIIIYSDSIPAKEMSKLLKEFVYFL